MEKRKTALYKCDPDKNKQCKKTWCAHNEKAVHAVCELTKHKEYSVDGQPIGAAYPPVKINAF